MPWVRLDDRFPSHRKVALLSDRAFRLHVSAICWCAENLTDGHIGERELALVTRIRGVKVTAKQLEDAGLWDRVDDGWVIHDYLDYNPSREQVLLERKKNAERQERFRRRKNGKPVPPSNGSSNGVTHDDPDAPETHDGDTNEARRRHDGDTTATGNHDEEPEDPQASAIRNGVTNGAPTRPDPTRTPYVVEVGEETTGSSELTVERSDDRPAFNAPIDDDGFALTDPMRRWALNTFGPGLDLDYETEQFISHFRADGGRRRNWPEEWKKWLRRSVKFASERQQRSNVYPLAAGKRPGGIRGPLPTSDEYARLTLEDVL